jgi:hypothetical protein
MAIIGISFRLPANTMFPHMGAALDMLDSKQRHRQKYLEVISYILFY